MGLVEGKATTYKGVVVSNSKWTGGAEGQVQYDPQESLLAIFSRWRGTVLPLVLKKWMFWLLIMVHVALLFANEAYNLPPMDVSIVIGLPASLLIFLTVFYNGNCYTRFFELWGHTCELTAIVNNWVLQTAFIFEELDLEDGFADGKSAKMENMDDAMWTTARRILSAMQMLFMALDVDIEEVDWLGRPTKLPNLMEGDGMEDEEYAILKEQGLLTDEEIAFVKAYPGFKCQVPIKVGLAHTHAPATCAIMLGLSSHPSPSCHPTMPNLPHVQPHPPESRVLSSA